MWEAEAGHAREMYGWLNKKPSLSYLLDIKVFPI